MSQNPYQFPDGQLQQAPKDNTLKIVLIVLGVLGGFALLVCGGLFALGFYAARQAEQSMAAFTEAMADLDFDMEYVDEDVMSDSLRQSDEVRAVVGEVESAYHDGEKTESENINGDTGQWYEVKGPTGTTWVVIEVSDDPERLADSAEIVSEDGTRQSFELPRVPYKRYDERLLYQLIKDDERLRQGIGDITRVTYNSDMSIDAVDPEFEYDSTFYYDVVGPQGTSVVVTDESDDIIVRQIRLPDGTKYTP